MKKHKEKMDDVYKGLKESITKETEKTEAFPRYVRVNLNKTTVEDIIQYFNTSEEYSYSEEPSELCFYKDPHLQDLLVFPRGANFHKHKLLVENKIILQDKSSCLSAHVLSAPKGKFVIDACSAPGNKTSHLSALMGNSGKIFAFEKDEKRFDLLKSFMNQRGCLNVYPIHTDFLQVITNEYKNVEYILVDPSCSGSGIINQQERKIDSQKNQKRIDALSQFQQKCILKAMEFPSVKRVCYSTCSIYEEENEHVVQSVLEANPSFKLVENILPQW
jgi:putative methyltransferase